MNSISDELIIVRCQRCLLEGVHNWMRIENSFPSQFMTEFFNPMKVEFMTLQEKMFLCKKHDEQYRPIDDENLELPKN